MRMTKNLTVLSAEREHQISARGKDRAWGVGIFPLKCAGNLYQESQER